EGKQPELVVGRAIERREQGIVAGGAGFAIARSDFESHPLLAPRREVRAQQRQAVDRPGGRPGRDRRLDQNSYGAFHVVVLLGSSLHEPETRGKSFTLAWTSRQRVYERGAT